MPMFDPHEPPAPTSAELGEPFWGENHDDGDVELEEWESRWQWDHSDATEEQFRAARQIFLLEREGDQDAPRETINTGVGGNRVTGRLDPEHGGEGSTDDQFALAATFATTDGFHVERTVSRASPGRPATGATSSAIALRLLLDRTDQDSLEDLKASLAPGRPSAARKAVRQKLVAAIRDLRQEKVVTSGALAEALGCSERTVERLAKP